MRTKILSLSLHQRRIVQSAKDSTALTLMMKRDREEEETMKKCSEVERRTDSDTQEKRRGRSLSPSNRHRTPRGPEEPGAEGPAAPRDRAEPGCHNGPSHPEGEGEGEEKEEKEEKEGRGGGGPDIKLCPDSPQS
ncbi:hypothetical protein F7725_020154 [Dissostichus mawsoni]|uniref:Uncharacterized protein n=1 Tax=Dissostichus mawsoni TaxID=36200 RepID=A0A7J5YCD9_DISMA|nr:hypothetical protein F7725_020154 [Dissostichus mawsoni]